MPNKNLLRFLQCVLERVAASCGVVVLYNKKVECEKKLKGQNHLYSEIIKTNFAKLISIIFENFDWLISSKLKSLQNTPSIIIFFRIRFYVVTNELSML